MPFANLLRPKRYPVLHEKDMRLQFHLRWQDHLREKGDERHFDPHQHLETLHSSLTPPAPPSSRPTDALREPARQIVLLFLLFLLTFTFLLTYYFHF